MRAPFLKIIVFQKFNKFGDEKLIADSFKWFYFDRVDNSLKLKIRAPMWVQIVDFCNFILQIFKKLKRKAVCLENIFMRRSCCHFILQICKKIEQES